MAAQRLSSPGETSMGRGTAQQVYTRRVSNSFGGRGGGGGAGGWSCSHWPRQNWGWATQPPPSRPPKDGEEANGPRGPHVGGRGLGRAAPSRAPEGPEEGGGGGWALEPGPPVGGAGMAFFWQKGAAERELTGH